MLTREDVFRLYAGEPPVDVDIIIKEVGRKYEIETLEGMAKDLAVIKTVNNILTQPYVSGKAIWEEQNLGSSNSIYKGFYVGEKEEVVNKGFDVPVEMRGNFFKWLQKSDNSPLNIVEVDLGAKYLKVNDPRGVEIQMPFGVAIETLEAQGFTKESFTDFFEFRADTTGSKLTVDEKGRLIYTPLGMQEAAWVEVIKGQYGEGEDVEPSKRGQDYAAVVNVVPGYGKEVLSVFGGVGGEELANNYAWKRADSMGNAVSGCQNISDVAQILAMTGSILV